MRRLVLVLAGMVLAAPATASAQAGACQLIESEYAERRATTLIYIRGPLLVRCTGGVEIRAAEGTLYETTREIQLVGQVFYQDPEKRLTSDRANYSSVSGRLHATGNVVFTDLEDGSTVRGPELEYYRAMPGRPEVQAIATQRPHLTLYPRGERGEQPREPFEIDADRMTMIGERQFSAIGQVVINRSDLDASGHEARYEGETERLELRGAARVRGERFELAGERIEVFMSGDQIERVNAQTNAVLTSDDLRVDADDLQLFVAEQLLQRMIARGSAAGADADRARPIATSRSFRLEADSIEAILPDQRLEQVIAVGAARGEAIEIPEGDEIVHAGPMLAGTPVATDRNWLVGDTVTGYFAEVEAQPAEGGESGAEREREVQLERLLATGSARSLYRVANDQDPHGRRGLNYLVGDTIDLEIRDGELELANVTGLQRGIYLDPASPDAAEEVDETPENGRTARGRSPQRARP